MKSSFTLRSLLVVITIFSSLSLFAQTDSIVWTNTTKVPTGYPATAFDSAGYAFSSTAVTPSEYTFVRLGLYKTIKPASTSTFLPFGDTTLSLREYAPTDTGAAFPVVATTGTFEANKLDSTRKVGRYIQFSFKVNANKTFTVTNISAPLFSGGGTTILADFQYSTDGTNFTTFLPGTLNTTPIKSSLVGNTIAVPNVKVTAGSTFYLRLVPFLNSTKASTGKGFGFEGLKIYGISVTLPVRFTNINASLLSNTVKVNWITEEAGTLNYSIEKSTTGSDFKEIGKIFASNSSNYSWIDQTPANGVNYYRVKSTDNNGTVYYSSVVKVLRQTKTGVTVFPNPVINKTLNLQIDGMTEGQYTVNIYNINGQKVSSTPINMTNSSLSQTLTLPNTAKAGIYQLELTNGVTRTTQTISVQ